MSVLQGRTSLSCDAVTQVGEFGVCLAREHKVGLRAQGAHGQQCWEQLNMAKRFFPSSWEYLGLVSKVVVEEPRMAVISYWHVGPLPKSETSSEAGVQLSTVEH